MDIPILISYIFQALSHIEKFQLMTQLMSFNSYIFHAPLHIKKFQLTTQLMSSNLLFLIPVLAHALCLLLPRLFLLLNKMLSESTMSRLIELSFSNMFPFGWVPYFVCILELESVSWIFIWNIRCAKEIGNIKIEMSVYSFLQKLQTWIPIPISYIFNAPSCIKKFQLRTQLMSSISYS